MWPRRYLRKKNMKILTASNSSCLFMWCLINMMLWTAFSTANGAICDLESGPRSQVVVIIFASPLYNPFKWPLKSLPFDPFGSPFFFPFPFSFCSPFPFPVVCGPSSWSSPRKVKHLFYEHPIFLKVDQDQPHENVQTGRHWYQVVNKVKTKSSLSGN